MSTQIPQNMLRCVIMIKYFICTIFASLCSSQQGQLCLNLYDRVGFPVHLQALRAFNRKCSSHIQVRKKCQRMVYDYRSFIN